MMFTFTFTFCFCLLLVLIRYRLLHFNDFFLYIGIFVVLQQIYFVCRRCDKPSHMTFDVTSRCRKQLTRLHEKRILQKISNWYITFIINRSLKTLSDCENGKPISSFFIKIWQLTQDMVYIMFDVKFVKPKIFLSLGSIFNSKWIHFIKLVMYSLDKKILYHRL